VDEAKKEFCKFRDTVEHVHQYDGVVAACLALAYEERAKHAHLRQQPAQQQQKGEARGGREEGEKEEKGGGEKNGNGLASEKGNGITSTDQHNPMEKASLLPRGSEISLSEAVKPQVDHTDAAIATLSDVPMGKFSLKQVTQWLNAVCEVCVSLPLNPLFLNFLHLRFLFDVCAVPPR